MVLMYGSHGMEDGDSSGVVVMVMCDVGLAVMVTVAVTVVVTVGS